MKDVVAIPFHEGGKEGVAMIDLRKINKIIDLLRHKDWAAAHEFLNDEEMSDPGEATVAYWRSVILRSEGRYQEALKFLENNLHRFECKTSVFHKRAELFQMMGKDGEALAEIENAPMDDEFDDHWALVLDAKFFRLYLMTLTGLPVAPEQWDEIPDGYISLMPTDEKVSKDELLARSRG